LRARHREEVKHRRRRIAARLHTVSLFATLSPASRAIRKGPATEQETVPGAAGKRSTPMSRSRRLSETAESPTCWFATVADAIGGFSIEGDKRSGRSKSRDSYSKFEVNSQDD